MVFDSCRVAIHERVGKAIRNPPRDVMLSHACLGLDYLLTGPDSRRAGLTRRRRYRVLGPSFSSIALSRSWRP
jgi:hypothetical protein